MKIAILHYTIPPIVGGVETVIYAHTDLLSQAGHQVSLIAGAGDDSNLPEGAEFTCFPEMDSRHPVVEQTSNELKQGKIPKEFKAITSSLEHRLENILESMDIVIVHNIFTKHFNLPLTDALTRIVENGVIKDCISWCHDITWTSPHSRKCVHPGYPWDLLRTRQENVRYVAVSKQRQEELAGLYNCPLDEIKVIYSGVDPGKLYGLSKESQALIEKLELENADLILIMPVRITQAKNIEFALQVIANLKARGVHPKLIVTGPPDPHDDGDIKYFSHLLDLRRQLQIENDVRFVYEFSNHTGNGYTIDTPVLSELYRACDVLFVPSHREGFGIPILEAGLIGMPIFSTNIPATEEIGHQEVYRFSRKEPAENVASQLLSWAQNSQTQKLKQRIRQNFTWQAIFRNDILPFLTRGS